MLPKIINGWLWLAYKHWKQVDGTIVVITQPIIQCNPINVMHYIVRLGWLSSIMVALINLSVNCKKAQWGILSRVGVFTSSLWNYRLFLLILLLIVAQIYKKIKWYTKWYTYKYFHINTLYKLVTNNAWSNVDWKTSRAELHRTSSAQIFVFLQEESLSLYPQPLLCLGGFKARRSCWDTREINRPLRKVNLTVTDLLRYLFDQAYTNFKLLLTGYERFSKHTLCGMWQTLK